MFEVANLTCVVVWFVGILIVVAIALYAMWLMQREIRGDTDKRR